MPNWAQTYEKNLVQGRPHGYRADALAVEPRWHVISYGWFAEFNRNATMLFTANTKAA